MVGAPGRGAVATAVVAGTLVLVGCAPEKNIDITNSAEGDVTVLLGDEETGPVPDDGGSSLLGVTDCYGPPLVVTYADGRTVEVAGRICPGDLLAVSDGGALLVPEAERTDG